jgi:4-hydroxy-tetrahydrodipicolinate reductase
MMITKILMVGCDGAMGRVISSQADERETCNVVAGVDREARQGDYPVYCSFGDIKEEIDAIIDFSSRNILLPLLDYAIKNNKSVVLATTGYTDKDMEAVMEASKKIPVFRSANMSYGINVMIKLIEKAAELLEDGYDIELMEKHHSKKVDSPSGTAKMLLRSINDTLNNKCNLVHGREGNDTMRQEREIGVHAIRGGTIAGEHEVMFAGVDEIIQIRHTATSKKVFAIGSIKAAEFMADKGPGFYDMNDML